MYGTDIIQSYTNGQIIDIIIVPYTNREVIIVIDLCVNSLYTY